MSDEEKSLVLRQVKGLYRLGSKGKGWVILWQIRGRIKAQKVEAELPSYDRLGT